MSAVTFAITNQKGGVGKTTTTASLGFGLAQKGKKVLLIDADPQGSLSISLGLMQPDTANHTLADLLSEVIRDTPVSINEAIRHHSEGVDFIPSNIDLSSLEVNMVSVISRETILRQLLADVVNDYDYILIDCLPSLGLLTLNALAAADKVIIPVQAEFLPAKGVSQLLQTINRVRRQINPKLKIEGILLTRVDSRKNASKEVSSLVKTIYGSAIKVFNTEIPDSVRAVEASGMGVSIYKHDPRGKVAQAYMRLTGEVLLNG